MEFITGLTESTAPLGEVGMSRNIMPILQIQKSKFQTLSYLGMGLGSLEWLI